VELTFSFVQNWHLVSDGLDYSVQTTFIIVCVMLFEAWPPLLGIFFNFIQESCSDFLLNIFLGISQKQKKMTSSLKRLKGLVKIVQVTTVAQS